MKTRKSKIWLVALVVMILVSAALAVAVRDRLSAVINETKLSEAQFQLAETQTLKVVDLFEAYPDSIKKEYEKELKEAESCIERGGWDVSEMEAHLSLAGWVIKDANISEEAKSAILKDLSEKIRTMRLDGYTKAASINLVNALSSAHGGYGVSMGDSLKEYKFCCSKARLKPDEEKIRKANEILSASLIERQNLRN